MRGMDAIRNLPAEQVEGEVALVIDYAAGKAHAKDVLQGAMNLIDALDSLDRALLSSISTHLEPVSILNDVQHSSLKMLLARALKQVPDELLNNLDWKQWIGRLLVKGKHVLLSKLDADAPELALALDTLAADYKAAPHGLMGYELPSVTQVQDALEQVAKAKQSLSNERVTVQTELGDIVLMDTAPAPLDALTVVDDSLTQRNTGVEFFKVKSPDMLGQAQWRLMRAGRVVNVAVLHKGWLERYHARAFTLLPGDSLKARFEEVVQYDSLGNELERALSIVQVLAVASPPSEQQGNLSF